MFFCNGQLNFSFCLHGDSCTFCFALFLPLVNTCLYISAIVRWFHFIYDLSLVLCILLCVPPVSLDGRVSLFTPFIHKRTRCPYGPSPVSAPGKRATRCYAFWWDSLTVGEGSRGFIQVLPVNAA